MKKPRRSISLKPRTYRRIQIYLEQRGGSASSFLEELIESKIGAPTEQERRKFDEETATRHARTQESDAQDELAGYVSPRLLL